MSQTCCKVACVLILFLHTFTDVLCVYEHERHHQTIDVVEQCKQVLRNSSGLAIVSSATFSKTDSQICVIRVDKANTYHLTFRRKFEKLNGFDRNFLHIAIYGHPPNQARRPLDEWDSEEDNFAKVVPGSELWLVITYIDDHVTHNMHDTGDFYWSVEYAAQMGENVPECDISSLEHPANGGVILSHSTLGSVVSLECFEGYVLENDREYAVCSVVESFLAWVRTNAICSSICNHPPTVQHATAHIEADTFSNNDQPHNSNQSTSVFQANRSTASPTSTVASYICNEPFIARGYNRIQCGYDQSGIPRWFDYPPSCVIPDCSATNHLKDQTGALVNPAYPSNNMLGGSLSCLWEITGPDDSHIHLTVTYLDLPEIPGVEVVIYDAGAARPRQLLVLNNMSGPVSVTSDTSRVKVSYKGPLDDIRGYQGFYIQYLIMPHESRHRRQISGPTESSDLLQSSLSSDSATQPVTSSPEMSSEKPSTLAMTHGNTDSLLPSTTSTVINQQPTELDTSHSKKDHADTNAQESTKEFVSGTTVDSTDDLTKAVTESMNRSTSEPTNQPAEHSTFISTNASTAEPFIKTSTEQSTTVSIILSSGTSPELSARTPTDQSATASTGPSTRESTIQSPKTSTETSREPSTGTSTEPSTEISAEPSIGTSSVQWTPTSSEQLTERSTDHFISEPTNLSTKESTEQQQTDTTTDQSPWNTSEAFMSIPTLPLNGTTIGQPASEESNDDWKIAVGIAIPIIVLISVLVGVYICYRKKYPIRMIIGREFPKFSNPNYNKTGRAPSLVREDADFFFANRNSANVSTQEFNPINNIMVYDNMGFIKDDASEEETEIEKDRKFLQSKSWLFKKPANETQTTRETISETTVESSFINDAPPRAGEGPDERGSERKASTEAGKSKPKAKPRKRRAPDIPINAQHTSDREEPEEQLPTSGVTSLRANLDALFHRASFDEVWADVKARSRSLNTERAPSDIRSRSLSIELLSKSARKSSLHDETILGTPTKPLLTPELSSQNSAGNNKVTASVVGVDIRDRQTSYASSVGADEMPSDFISEEKGERSDSVRSHDSNSDDVTDSEESKSQPRNIHSNSPTTRYDDTNRTYQLQKPDGEYFSNSAASVPNTVQLSSTGNSSNSSDRNDHLTTKENINVKDTLIPDSQVQVDGNDPDVTCVRERSIDLKNIKYKNNMASSMPSERVAEGNPDNDLVSVPERGPPSDSESSTSSSNSEETKDRLHEVSSAHNVRTEQDGNIVSDHVHSSNKPLPRDILQFDASSRERNSSGSSTESVIGSSESSRGASSDDEEVSTSNPISANFERSYPGRDVPKTDQVNRSRSQELDMNSASVPAYPSDLTANSSELQYSDSSSDSPNILPGKDIVLVSRQPPSSAYVPVGDKGPRELADVDGDLSDTFSDDECENDDDDDDGVDGVDGYKLRDEDSQDEDIDV